MLRNSWGWGVVGCDNIHCTWTHVWCYATVGVGVGRGVITFIAHKHMFDATQQLGLGWGVITFIAHEHMFDATQQLCFLLGWSRSLHLPTCSMLRSCCVSCGDVHVPCAWTHVECYATHSRDQGKAIEPARQFGQKFRVNGMKLQQVLFLGDGRRKHAN